MTASTRLAMLIALAGAPALRAEPIDITFKVNGNAVALKHAGVAAARDYHMKAISLYQVILSEKAPADGVTTFEKALDGELGAFVLATFDTKLDHRADEFHAGEVKEHLLDGDGDMLHADDMKLEDGKLSGRLHTGGATKTSDGVTIELDAAFSLAVPAS
jgi:hypothetical protein